MKERQAGEGARVAGSRPEPPASLLLGQLVFNIGVTVAGVVLLVSGWMLSRDSWLIAGSVLTGSTMIARKIPSGRDASDRGRG